MTATDYNEIADQYRESKLQSWRAHVEAHTLLKLAGDVRGQSVIDLACGEGHYSRTLQKRGAQVVGVDIAEQMINLARASEQRAPLGIEYLNCDVRELDDSHNQQYDLVFAAWLLNYARNANELLEICTVIARLLKPGGRLVAINTEPNDPPANFKLGKVYGFTKRVEGGDANIKNGMPVEGAAVVWTLFLDNGEQFDITNYHLARSTVTRCVTTAGLTDITFHPPMLSPDADDGDGFWQPLLTQPPFVFIECVNSN